MLGLFGTLNLGQRALQAHRQGIEVSGHNLANVNTPGYARQRVAVETSATVADAIASRGTGVQVGGISQVRDALRDAQIQSEASVTGYLEAEQSALQLAQTHLGQQIDRSLSGADGTSAAQTAGTQYGLSEGLSELFNAFQSLSTQPASLTERQAVLASAQRVAQQFNQADKRLTELKAGLDSALDTDITAANGLLREIADLNNRITAAENSYGGAANDLRDTRQQKLEALGKLVKAEVTAGDHGAADISIGGVSFVSGRDVAEKLETYDAGDGQRLVRAQGSGAPLALTGGSAQGRIEVRDGAVSQLQGSLRGLASLLIAETNAAHAGGYSLSGATGANFFAGTDASDIAVNSALLNDPAALQISGTSGATGDNRVAVALAQLAEKKHSALGGQTFGQSYSLTVAALGEALQSSNARSEDQAVVTNMLLRQRDAVSGVSVDEELTDLMKYQKAYEASAKLIHTIDEMLDTVLSLKR